MISCSIVSGCSFALGACLHFSLAQQAVDETAVEAKAVCFLFPFSFFYSYAFFLTGFQPSALSTPHILCLTRKMLSNHSNLSDKLLGGLFATIILGLFLLLAVFLPTSFPLFRAPSCFHTKVNDRNVETVVITTAGGSDWQLLSTLLRLQAKVCLSVFFLHVSMTSFALYVSILFLVCLRILSRPLICGYPTMSESFLWI